MLVVLVVYFWRVVISIRVAFRVPRWVVVLVAVLVAVAVTRTRRNVFSL